MEIKEESKNVIPIIGMNRVLGSIEILSHQGLNEDQMIIIKAAANQLGNALERETYLFRTRKNKGSDGKRTYA